MVCESDEVSVSHDSRIYVRFTKEREGHGTFLEVVCLEKPLTTEEFMDVVEAWLVGMKNNEQVIKQRLLKSGKLVSIKEWKNHH